MIHEKDFLGFWEDLGIPAHIQFNDSLTLDLIERILKSPEALPSLGIQYTLEREQIKSGGMFNKKLEDCITLRTQEIEGASAFLFTCQGMGNMSRMTIYRGGVGKAQAQLNKKNNRMKGGALSLFAGMLTKVDSEQFDKEEFYYNAVINVIKEQFLG